MFFNLKSILPKSIKRAGASQQVQDTQVIKVFNETKDKLLPDNLARKIKPMYIKDGKLVIASLSSLAVHELQKKEAVIIKKINQEFNSQIVKKLKYLT